MSLLNHVCAEDTMKSRNPRGTICVSSQINEVGATNTVSSNGMEEHIEIIIRIMIYLYNIVVFLVKISDTNRMLKFVKMVPRSCNGTV